MKLRIFSFLMLASLAICAVGCGGNDAPVVPDQPTEAPAEGPTKDGLPEPGALPAG